MNNENNDALMQYFTDMAKLEIMMDLSDKLKYGTIPSIIITLIIFIILRTGYSLFAFIVCVCCGVISYLLDLSNKKKYRNFKNNIHNKNINERGKNV